MSYNKTLDFSSILIGQKVCYYTGDLMFDRQQDPQLDIFAEKILSKSNTLLKEYPNGKDKHRHDVPQGSGEFLLYQNKIELHVYEYYLVRIKNAPDEDNRI